MSIIRTILLFPLLAVLIFSCEKNDSEPTLIDPETLIPTEIAVDSVQEFKQIISAHAEAERLGLSFFFSDFEPTGVYLKSNATLTLNVSLLEGSEYPELLVGTYSRGTDWNRQPQSYRLQSGLNTISVKGQGGMVYVRYITDAEPKGKIRIKFISGWKHSPIYRYNQTTNSNWNKMLKYFSDVPTATLVGNKEFLVVSRKKAIDFQNKNQDKLLETIDEVINVQNNLSGMDSSKDIHKPMSHKLLMCEYLGDEYYMFAYWYRTAYRKSDAVQYILDPESLRTDGWGPWHELGHMHQMNAWTWSGVVESTVNLYSLAVEKHFGISPSRFKRENRWGQVKSYLEQADEQRDFNAASTDIWVRLGMFYQLQLAFGDNFLKELHKYIRVQNPTIYNDEDKMRTFMLAACNASGKDLTGFFKKWGMKFAGSDEVYNEISNLGLAEPDQDVTLQTD
ncbi:MAG: M60 family metallopeptidase [Carboxylicivirga sp.]|nr:M60 family metallopeptidase [Carboxylicivirga sp.]